MQTRITSASLNRLAKVLARLGVAPAACQPGVTYVQASGAQAAMTVRITRITSPLPGFAADIYTGADATTLGA